MESTRTVLFLCPHNAAKSVMAAAYCRLLAERRRLDVRVDSAGTEPSPKTSPAVVAALQAEGLDVSGHRPRRVTDDDLTAAWRVVSLGCVLEQLRPSGTRVERWDDVPSPSYDLPSARAAILRHLDGLLNDLARET